MNSMVSAILCSLKYHAIGTFTLETFPVSTSQNHHTPHGTAIFLLGVEPTDVQTHVHQQQGTRVFISHLSQAQRGTIQIPINS